MDTERYGILSFLPDAYLTQGYQNHLQIVDHGRKFIANTHLKCY